MELLWKTESNKKTLRLLKRDLVCSPRMHEELNILNISCHASARKLVIIEVFFQQQQPSTVMLADMCTNMKAAVSRFLRVC